MADLSLVLGTGVFAAGMVTGRAWPARRRKSKPVKPLCGCKHHISYHENLSGSCQHKRGIDHDVPCKCQAYSGPQPLPEYYAPEIGH